MALTRSSADAALKEFYLPTAREQLNNAIMLVNQIESNSQDVEGRRVVLSLHIRRSSGVGARAEGGTLPAAGNQGYAEQRVPLYYNYGRIKVSGPVLRAMKSDRGSFVRAVESEMRGITNDLKRDYNRQLHGTSDGVIAALGVTSASTTVNFGSGATDVQKRQVEVGMLVDIGTVANPTGVASAREVTAVDVSAGTFDINGAAVTTAATDRVFRSGNGGDSAGVGQKEVTGLQDIVEDTGTLHNVDPTVEPAWKATVLDNSGTERPISENLLAEAMHETSINGGSDINLWLTSDGVFRSYGATLQAQKRFQNTIDLKGGFRAISVSAGGGEVPLTWDRDHPENEATGLNTAHLFEKKSSDWEWMDEDGAVLNRVSGEDAYEAVLFKYSELCTDKRNAHCRIEDLIES